MLRQGIRQLASVNRRYSHRVSEGNYPRDSVQLKGLVFHGYHGVLPEENTLGQKFVVDATIFADLRHAGKTDDLHDTLDYAAIYDKIKTIVEGKPHKLVETLAERIAGAILAERKVDSVQVQVRKPHVAVPGVVESLGVEIYRTR